MSASLILAILISAAVLYGVVRARRTATHHLDDLHIIGGSHGKK
ncbi:MAG: hypothetical protein V3R94_11395 [Acidobacteriota bacterium]